MPRGSIPNRSHLANWLVLNYLIDLLSIVRGDRHPMDALLLITISQANLAQITSKVDLQVAYAEDGAPPPDELRRPISVHALAQSLRIPFETARRRVRAMEDAGLCVAARGGLIVPTEVLTSATFRSLQSRVYDRVRRLFWDLDGHGLLPPLQPGSVEFAGDAIPLRLVARTSTDFNLRLMDAQLEAQGNLVDVLVLQGIIHANLAHLEPETAGLRAWVHDDITRDYRRPASAARIAAQLGMPAETIRRRAHGMQQAGLCTVGPGGILVSLQLLASRRMRGIMGSNLANLDRMLQQLAETGVLALWRAQGRPGA